MNQNHCQICEGGFTSNKKYMSKPVMSNHGFTRPGDGWLHGSCFGAKHYPYEISCDRIQPYIDMVTEYRQGRLDFIKNLISNPPTELTAPSITMRSDEVRKVFPRPTDFDSKKDYFHGSRYNSYEGNFGALKSDAEWQVKKSTREIERMEKRLADWKPTK